MEAGRRLSDLPALVSGLNGDGVGDLNGILGRLDYLSWLGVDGNLDFAGLSLRRWRTSGTTFPTIAVSIRCSGRWKISTGCCRKPIAAASRSSSISSQSYVGSASMVPGEPIVARLTASAIGTSGAIRSRRRAAEQLGVAVRRAGLDPRSGDRPILLHGFLRQQPDLNWRNPAVRDAMYDGCGSGSTAASTVFAST